MGDPKDSAFRRIGQAFNFPAVGQHDLLDDSQSKAGACLLSGEVGFEDLGAAFRRDPGAVVADLQRRFGSAAFF